MSGSSFSRRSKFDRLLHGTAGMTPVVALLAAPQPALAAALPAANVVGVCSGVSLPKSAVTDLVTPIVQAGVTPLQTATNGILHDGLLANLLGPLAGTTVNVDLTSTVAQVGSGAPISLQVLSDGNTLLGPQSTCYSRSDGVTLTTPAGIAIGGNVISGLGDTAQPAAKAGELNSIAFGNKATTDATALGAIAIGTNSAVGAASSGAVAIGNGAGVTAANGVAIGNGSSATMANSVALGAGSTTTRGPSTYTGYALTVPTVSAGEVSVGTATATRQITNVAAGSTTNDAVNVGQLTAVNTQVQTNSTAIAGLTTSVTKNTADIATNVGDIAGLKTTVGQTAATLATSVGDIAGLKTSVTQNTTNITANTTDIAGLKTSVGANTADISGLKTSVGVNTTDISGLKTSVGANTADITGLKTTVGTNSTDIAGLKTSVAQNTTDIAANVSDITGLKTTVGTNSSDISGLKTTVGVNTTDIAGLKTSVGANTTDIAGLKTTVGTNSTDISGLKTTVGINSTDIAGLKTSVGVNTTDIAGLKTSVTQNTTDIATNVGDIAGLKTTVGTNSTDISGLKTTVGVNTTDIAGLKTSVGANTTDIAGLKTSVTQNTTDIATNVGDIAGLKTTVGTNSTDISGLKTTVGVNTTDIAGLKASVGTNSTDIATNIGDIAGLKTTVGTNTTDIAGLKTSVSQNTGDIAGLATRVTTNEGNITTIDARVTRNSADIALNTTAIDTLRGDVGNGLVGPVHYSDATTPTKPNTGTVTDDVTLVGASGGAVGLHNVADGAVSATSTDAVNGSQLYTLQSEITGSGGTAVAYDDTSRSHVTLGGTKATAPVGISNLADGALADGSRDAVTGSQLFATNQSVGGLTTRVTAAEGDIATAKTSIATVEDRVTTAESSITGLDTQVATNAGDIKTVDARISGVSDRVTVNSGAITTLGSQFATFSAAVTNGGVGPVQYSDAATPTASNNGTPTNDVTLVGAKAGAVGLHNVAPGVLSATSTDAVNGAQLYAIETSVSAGGSPLAVVYDDAGRDHLTLGGGGATARVGLSNLADGTIAEGSSDAVTGGQLYATDTRVATVSSDLDKLSGVVTGFGGTLTTLGAQYTSLSTGIANGSVGPVRYSNAATPTVANGGTPSQDLTLVGGGFGTVGLHNLTDGRIGIGSSDAVTGGQLAATGTAIASTLGVTYNAATNSFTGDYTYDGNHYATVQDALDAIQPGSTSSTGDGTSAGGGIKYFHTNSTATDSNATGVNSTAIGASAVATGDNAVAMGNGAQAISTSAVAIGDGATAQDGKAVSIGVGNMASGDGAVSIGDPNVAMGDGSVALGRDNTATGTGTVALGDTNTVTGDDSVAIGGTNRVTGQASVALGDSNIVKGDSSIAVGSNNQVTGARSTAFGENNAVNGNNALAIGSETTAGQTDSLAIGNSASASGAASIALGNRSSANTIGATSLGVEAMASGTYGVAVGQGTVASGFGTTAAGHSAIASGDGSLALGAGAVASTQGGVALGALSEATRGAQADYSAFGLDTAQTSQGEVAIAVSGTATNPAGTVVAKGGRQITGVAAGSADTDAVNVAQLRGVSSALGTAVATGLGGGATYNAATGQVTGSSYTVAGVTYGNVGDALTALASRGTGTGTGTASDPGAVHYSGGGNGAITLAPGGTLISNVAAGGLTAASTDAVNGGQLAATNAQVATLADKVDSGATGTVQYSNASAPTTANGGTKTNDVTLVGADAATPVALHNVASGTVASGSTDAVNGGQLAVTNARVATVETTANSALAMGQGAVQYDDATHGSMTLGSAATPVAVHNVADGTADHDAVNVSQLVGTANAALGAAESYTDTKVAQLAFDLGKVRKDQAAGTAGALAMAGMPQPYEAGRGMISAGFGTFLGQTAIAVGLAKALSDEHTVIKAGATYNSRGSVGANVGIGYQF